MVGEALTSDAPIQCRHCGIKDELTSRAQQFKIQPEGGISAGGHREQRETPVKTYGDKSVLNAHKRMRLYQSLDVLVPSRWPSVSTLRSR